MRRVPLRITTILGDESSPSPAPPTHAEEELYWLALRMVPGLGTRRIGLLLERLRTPQAIFRASASELEGRRTTGALARPCERLQFRGRRQPAAESARGRRATDHPRTTRAIPSRCAGSSIRRRCCSRAGASELLSLGLHRRGGHAPPHALRDGRGRAACRAIWRAPALTITSGMARGIDTAAHKAALAAEGTTIAVLGCGVDIVYPSENRKLAAEIAAKGLIISEFPMGATAFPQNFPIRNRIISGLSCGILVVEGAQYSGSAITARLAIDQGREVFAVPGNITSKMSWGPNLLIKQGAKLVQDWNDVVVELPQTAQRRLIDEGRQRIMNQGLASRPLNLPAETAASEQPH